MQILETFLQYWHFKMFVPKLHLWYFSYFEWSIAALVKFNIFILIYSYEITIKMFITNL